MADSENIPVLFGSARDCCGCGACAAACRRGSIEMREDARGFVFPEIDASSCVGCGACVKACGLHERLGFETSGPWYAAAGKGDVSESASGGVFAALAREVMAGGGCAFGAAYERFDGGLRVGHRMAEDEVGLAPLLNSKYVQSDAGRCFAEVRRQLETGRQVLFCGTPCQVAGLRGFLGRDWSNLVTADLVCHGVPSERLFNGCVLDLAERYGSPVVDFRFRCKRDGWGHSLLLLLLLQDGREVTIPAGESPYYDMFLKLKTLRDSCYACPYAGSFRAGDVTLGDFWGVERNRPDVLEDGSLGLRTGVSCLLANNERGREFICRHRDALVLKEVSFDDVAKGNDQLRFPSVLPGDRDRYLSAFERRGWAGILRVWRWRERGPLHYAKRVASKVLPKAAKEAIKAAIRKR